MFPVVKDHIRTMLSLKNNFTYKYSSAKNIYCITDRKCASTHRMGVYSIAHKNERAVVGFTDFKQCHVYVRRLQQDMNNLEIDAVRLDLKEIKYICHLMKLPVCVIMNESDREEDEFDVHYIRPAEDIIASSISETYHQSD